MTVIRPQLQGTPSPGVASKADGGGGLAATGALVEKEGRGGLGGLSAHAGWTLISLLLVWGTANDVVSSEKDKRIALSIVGISLSDAGGRQSAGIVG